MIRTRRAYDTPGRAGEGRMFLVDRVWPRGIRKADLPIDGWAREVAPSTELRKEFHRRPGDWGRFVKRYRQELEGNPNALEPLLEAARSGDLTLIYSSRDTNHNNAVVLRDYLKEKLGGPGTQGYGSKETKEEPNMAPIGELFQSADWKTEKHVPVIECPDRVKTDEMFAVKVSIGKEVAHPNTTAHHIRWISLYFHPEGEKFPVQIGRFEFSAHGASTDGPDTSTVYTHHEAAVSMKTSKPGTLLATSLCNIHGLWTGDRKISIG